MTKKFIVAWVVVFIAWFMGSFVVHGVLLHADYMQVPTLFRMNDDAHVFFPLMILAYLPLSGAFVWIYARGIASKPWVGQGLRYGIAVALLATVPNDIIDYAVQPLPGMMVIKQIIFESILVVVLGLVVAWLYRGATTA